MIKKVPHKIDMGAVYTKEPNQKAYIAKDAFKLVAREFILDIDLTDYQEDGTIKSNCIDPTDPDFCKSWKFMAIACKVLDVDVNPPSIFEKARTASAAHCNCRIAMPAERMLLACVT